MESQPIPTVKCSNPACGKQNPVGVVFCIYCRQQFGRIQLSDGQLALVYPDVPRTCAHAVRVRSGQVMVIGVSGDGTVQDSSSAGVVQVTVQNPQDLSMGEHTLAIRKFMEAFHNRTDIIDVD